jgi:hypothetical protein
LLDAAGRRRSPVAELRKQTKSAAPERPWRTRPVSRGA